MANDHPTNWLYVSRLGRGTDKIDIQELFSKYGHVLRVNTLTEGNTAVYIQYADVESAIGAVRNLNGHVFHGKRMKVCFKREHLGPVETSKMDSRNLAQFRAKGPSSERSLSGLSLEVLFYLKAVNSAEIMGKKLGITCFVNLKNHSIEFKGAMENINHAFSDMSKIVESLCNRHFKERVEFCKCFSKLAKPYLLEEFKKHHIRAGLDIRNEEVLICSNDDSSVNKANDIIHSIIGVWEYPKSRSLSKHEKQQHRAGEWQQLKTELEELVPEIVIGYDEEKSRVVFACYRTSPFDLVLNKMELLLTGDTQQKLRLKIDEWYDLCLLELNQELLRKKSDACYEFDDRSKTCTITSPTSAEAGKALIEKLVQGIVVKHVKEENPAFCQWLCTDDGKSNLADVCQLTFTVCKMNKLSTELAGIVGSLDRTPSKSLPKISIEAGDIANARADLLVSSQGKIEEAFYLKSNHCLREGLNQLQSGQLIYHISDWPSSETSFLMQLQNNIMEILNLANSKPCTSVTFPIIGAGKRCFDLQKICKTYADSIKQWQARSGKVVVREITIVIQEQLFPLWEGVVKKAFEADMVDLPSTLAPRTLNSGKQSEHIGLYFKGLTQQTVDNAVTKYQKLKNEKLKTVNWDNDPLRSRIMQLTPDQIESLRQTAAAGIIELTIDQKKQLIVATGLATQVEQLREQINAVLHGIDSGVYPLTWDTSVLESGKGAVKLEVKSDNPEFQKVRDLFSRSCPSKQVFRIYRIQNKYLYTQYRTQLESTQESMASAKTIIEQQLWHGTDYTSAQNIYSKHFNRSFAGKNGVSYGQGVYFSNKASYSIQYSRESPVPDAEGFLILARVITGDFMKGNSSINGKNIPPHIHSTVNDEQNPSIFVVYHDAAAYPEYEVYYRTPPFVPLY